MPKLYDLPVEFRVYDVEGVVLDNPNDFIVVEEPKEFEAFRMRLERIVSDDNIPRHGFNFDYGDPETPMVFIKASGYQLIKDIYDIKGSDSEIVFEFGTKAPTYDRKFFATLDMNTYEREWINGEPRLKVNVEQESLAYKINSRLETTLNLLASKDLDGNAITPLVMEEHYWHGKVIRKLGKLETGNQITFAEGDETDFAAGREVEIFFVKFPHKSVLADFTVFEYGGTPLFFFDEPDMDGFFSFNAQDEGKYSISYDLAVFLEFTHSVPSPSDAGTLVLEYKINEDGTKQILETNSTPLNTAVTPSASIWEFGEDQTGLWSGNFEVELKKGDNLYIFYRYFSLEEEGLQGPTVKDFSSFSRIRNTFISIEALTRPRTTLVRSLPIFEYINRQLELVSGLSNVLVSDYYGRTDLGNSSDGCGSQRWLTNGTQIRNFAVNERPPESSFFDTLNSLSMIDDIGYGYEKENGDIKVRMETSDYYYQDAEILKIGKISNVENQAVGRVLSYKERNSDEIIYNEVILKFSKYIDEELNTLDSFNTEAEYLTPIFTKSLKLELISEFIADAYTIEYTRRKQFEESPSESWQYDNDIFITDWVEITKLRGAGDINTLGYQGQAFIGNDSTITLPLIIPELVDLTIISWAIGQNPPDDYTVDTVTFDEVDNQTIITVLEATTQLSGNIEFIFGDGFSFKRPESDQNFSTINNLISPVTTYNLRMSLKRLLMKHAKWINSGLNYKQITDVITTQFIDRNKTLETQFDSDADCFAGDLNRILLNESADLELSDMYNFGRYFIPTRVDYEIELSFNDNEILRKALTNQSSLGFEYGYVSILDEEGNYQKIYVNLHDYKPFSSTCEGWGYKKYEA